MCLQSAQRSCRRASARAGRTYPRRSASRRCGSGLGRPAPSWRAASPARRAACAASGESGCAGTRHNPPLPDQRRFPPAAHHPARAAPAQRRTSRWTAVRPSGTRGREVPAQPGRRCPFRRAGTRRRKRAQPADSSRNTREWPDGDSRRLCPPTRRTSCRTQAHPPKRPPTRHHQGKCATSPICTARGFPHACGALQPL